jgi:hypothetical protein
MIVASRGFDLATRSAKQAIVWLRRNFWTLAQNAQYSEQQIN